MTTQTMTNIYIREAREEDRAAIREVTLAAFEQYAAPLGEKWPDYRRSMMATVTNPAPALQLVAEVDATIVGTGLLYPAGTVFTTPNGSSLSTPFPEMRLLAVSPAMRSRGVGNALMRARVERARAWGAQAVVFHTTALMRAEPLYARVGGFVRAPEFDVEIAEDVKLEAYRLELRR